MDLTIEKNIRDNPQLRESFMELAIKTFDLSFKTWYQDGYWTDKYVPYSIIDKGKVVANASVNIIDTVWDSCPKRYIQIGTVMTDVMYQGRGLSRCIMEEILREWKNNSNAIYLFANDTVLDFYPKFGFVKEKEYQCTIPIVPQASNVKKLDMSKKEDRELLRKYYAKSNPFSILPMLNNYGLLMFYCSSFMKDCIFYCEELDAVVIAMQENDILTCFDIYCDEDRSLHDILAAIPGKETRKAVLGFTPTGDLSGYIIHAVDDENSTLFMLQSKDNVFAHSKVMFPSLSHA